MQLFPVVAVIARQGKNIVVVFDAWILLFALPWPEVSTNPSLSMKELGWDITSLFVNVI